MSKKQSTSRRDFLRAAGGSGAFAGYSLFVRMNDAEAAEIPLPAGVENTITGVAAKPGAPVPHEPNMIRLDLECDFLVAGGGMAGICAALAAARHGA